MDRLFGLPMFDGRLRMNKRRQLLYQALKFGMTLGSVLIFWKGLMVASGCESPLVAVLSGSMEPAMYRGDLLFVNNYSEETIRTGDIMVFKIEGQDIPIVHRVIKVHRKANITTKFLTKGDNNNVDDRVLYAPGQHWLTPADVVGRVRGIVPYVGMASVVINDYPKLKYALISIVFIRHLYSENSNT